MSLIIMWCRFRPVLVDKLHYILRINQDPSKFTMLIRLVIKGKKWFDGRYLKYGFNFYWSPRSGTMIYIEIIHRSPSYIGKWLCNKNKHFFAKRVFVLLCRNYSYDLPILHPLWLRRKLNRVSRLLDERLIWLALSIFRPLVPKLSSAKLEN